MVDRGLVRPLAALLARDFAWEPDAHGLQRVRLPLAERSVSARIVLQLRQKKCPAGSGGNGRRLPSKSRLRYCIGRFPAEFIGAARHGSKAGHSPVWIYVACCRNVREWSYSPRKAAAALSSHQAI